MLTLDVTTENNVKEEVFQKSESRAAGNNGQGNSLGSTEGNASSAKGLTPTGGFPLFLYMLLLSLLFSLVMDDNDHVLTLLHHFILIVKK